MNESPDIRAFKSYGVIYSTIEAHPPAPRTSDDVGRSRPLPTHHTQKAQRAPASGLVVALPLDPLLVQELQRGLHCLGVLRVGDEHLAVTVLELEGDDGGVQPAGRVVNRGERGRGGYDRSTPSRHVWGVQCVDVYRVLSVLITARTPGTAKCSSKAGGVFSAMTDTVSPDVRLVIV